MIPRQLRCPVLSVTEEFSVTAGGDIAAKEHAESEFEKYRVSQDRAFRSDFDRFVELEAEELVGERSKSVSAD
ncbi:hypothetical protein R80B4_00470 [Fibrobacteres bacterium R8-0-B4]